MIVSAAHMKNVAVLLTEDLNVRQQMEGMTVVNPFVKWQFFRTFFPNDFYGPTTWGDRH